MRLIFSSPLPATLLTCSLRSLLIFAALLSLFAEVGGQQLSGLRRTRRDGGGGSGDGQRQRQRQRHCTCTGPWCQRWLQGERCRRLFLWRLRVDVHGVRLGACASLPKGSVAPSVAPKAKKKKKVEIFMS
jgi:hypothetical protein